MQKQFVIRVMEVKNRVLTAFSKYHTHFCTYTAKFAAQIKKLLLVHYVVSLCLLRTVLHNTSAQVCTPSAHKGLHLPYMINDTTLNYVILIIVQLVK